MQLKKNILTVLLLPVIVLSSGCLDAEQSLVINADGSGTFEVDYVLPEATARRVNSMLALSEILPEAKDGESSEVSQDKFIDLLFNPTEESLRKHLEAYAKLGFTIDEFKFKNQNAKRRASFILSFEDVSVLSKADFFHTYGFALRKNAGGQYVLYNRPVTREDVPATSWDFADPDTRKKVAPFLNEFRFAINITVPGRILKSNAHQTTGKTMNWTYSFDADPYAVQKLQRNQLNAVFDGSVATLPLFEQPARP